MLKLGGGYKFTLSKECYLNLPYIEINIKNNKFPEDKENYLDCSFKISNTENSEYDFAVDMAEAGIRLRGNSTLTKPKKPFRIKFSSKQSLLGLKKNKSWVLLADYLDQSNIRNYTAFKIAHAISDDFAPTGQHVVLFINGSYQGVYLLCEQINENSGRTNIKTDIDPTTQNSFPFLVEMDHNALYEGVTGVDNFNLEGLWEPMEIKYPELSDRNLQGGEDKVFNYIKEHMWAVLYTLKYDVSVSVSFSDTAVAFSDLVDEESYLNYILINELMGNYDNGWKSIYFYKTAEGKLKFGPIGDFDFSGTINWTGAPFNEMTDKNARQLSLMRSGYFQGCYFSSEERYNKVVERFNLVKNSVIDVVMDLADYYDVIKTASIIDAKYWYGENGEYMFSSQFSAVRLYVLDKVHFLENEFNKTYEEFIKNI